MNTYNISLLEPWRVKKDKSGYLGKVDEVVTDISLLEVAGYLLEYSTTMATFHNNIRKKTSLNEIQFIQYDFDNGHPYENIVKLLDDNNLNYIIAASQSHMEIKTGHEDKGIIPRYHLYIPLNETITCYEYYVNVIQSIFPEILENCDANPKDASRYFKKHKEILSFEDEHDNYDISNISKELSYKTIYNKQKYTSLSNIYNKIQDELSVITSLYDDFQKNPSNTHAFLKHEKYYNNNRNLTSSETQLIINDIICNAPIAIEGNSGDLILYKTTIKIYSNGGTIDDVETYNSMNCSPKFSKSEIEHKWYSAIEYIGDNKTPNYVLLKKLKELKK